MRTATSASASCGAGGVMPRPSAGARGREFWPPKPKALTRATRTSRCRATSGVRSMSPTPGSGSVRLSVGGTQPSRIASSIATAAMAPGGAQRVADGALGGGDGDPRRPLAEERPDGGQLLHVAARRARRVGRDEVDARRRRCPPCAAPDGPPAGHPRPAGRGQRDVAWRRRSRRSRTARRGSGRRGRGRAPAPPAPASRRPRRPRSRPGPSRTGRLAPVGSSLRVDSARMAAKPATVAS